MSVDEFGIRKIYPTNTHPNRAKPWLLGKGDWAKRRYNGVGDWNDMPISTDADGNFIVTLDTSGHKGRMPVLSLRLDRFPRDENNSPIVHAVKNQSKLRKRGFMSGSKSDWKNVEMTMYWRVRDTVHDPDVYKAMAFSARGGPHHSEGGIFRLSRCWGTALYVALTFEGQPIVTKELGHGREADGIRIGSVTGRNIMNKWIGMKGVFYTKANGNPYIELWIDKNAHNDWELVLSKEDDGSWFLSQGVSNDCGGERNEKITWGGPGVIFKLDRITVVDMKWTSVREIVPPEGWPLRYLLNARNVPSPFSMRSLADEYGLTAPISLRRLTQLEAEKYPFP
jgi:hypothetical protein